MKMEGVGWGGAGRVLGRQPGSAWEKQWGLDWVSLQVNKGFWPKVKPFSYSKRFIEYKFI
jgi:hypothetical protein